MVYIAFVVDIFSCAIVGWAASTTKRTRLVLDALDMALWRRDRAGRPVGPGLVHHSDAGSRYTSFRFTTHLVEAGIDASIGTVGDALDNAFPESTTSPRHVGRRRCCGRPRRPTGRRAARTSAAPRAT